MCSLLLSICDAYHSAPSHVHPCLYIPHSPWVHIYPIIGVALPLIAVGYRCAVYCLACGGLALLQFVRPYLIPFGFCPGLLQEAR